MNNGILLNVLSKPCNFYHSTETTPQSRGSQPSSPPKDTGQNQSDSSSASPSHNEDTSKE